MFHQNHSPKSAPFNIYFIPQNFHHFDKREDLFTYYGISSDFLPTHTDAAILKLAKP
jgi:hypothetical protein